MSVNNLPKRLMRLFILLFIFLNTIYANEKPLNILLFRSYNQTFPWAGQFLDGIEKFRQDSSKKIDVYIETIDYMRLKEQMKPEDWKDYLQKKYKGLKFDGVIVETIFASKMFYNISNEIYPDIPKIYISNLNVENQKNAIKMNSPRVKVVKETINLAKLNNQNLKNIYIIEPEDIGKELKEILLTELKNESFNVVLLKDLSMEELKNTLSNLPTDSAAFYIFNLEDKSDKFFVPRDFLQEISLNSNIPIYSFWSIYTGYGTIGGYQYDGKMIAIQSLTSLVNKIEKGYYLPNEYEYKLILDYNILEKFNLHKKRYPDDAVIINKPIPVWETYPKEALFALSTILLLSLVLILTNILRNRNVKIIRIEERMLYQSKQATLGEMINVITHQWRQPLNNISIIVQTLFLKYKKKKIDDIIMSKFEINILKQIYFMSETIDDFKNFYKTDIEKKEFNIKEELLKTVDLIQSYYLRDNINIKINEILNFNILGYQNELRHCFLIILENANDALQKSEKIEKYIIISSEIRNNKYKIIIENNGEQIPNNIIDKILDPYFSTKNRENNTGIGLFIAKTIIEKHFKGSLEVSNTINGVKFEIFFDMNLKV